jgi:hypothetical protein
MNFGNEFLVKFEILYTLNLCTFCSLCSSGEWVRLPLDKVGLIEYDKFSVFLLFCFLIYFRLHLKHKVCTCPFNKHPNFRRPLFTPTEISCDRSQQTLYSRAINPCCMWPHSEIPRFHSSLTWLRASNSCWTAWNLLVSLLYSFYLGGFPGPWISVPTFRNILYGKSSWVVKQEE